jgi:hypothetical protein
MRTVVPFHLLRANLGDDSNFRANHRRQAGAVLCKHCRRRQSATCHHQPRRFGAIKAEIEAPETFVANAVRKAQQEGLIERALATGEVLTTTL